MHRAIAGTVNSPSGVWGKAPRALQFAAITAPRYLKIKLSTKFICCCMHIVTLTYRREQNVDVKTVYHLPLSKRKKDTLMWLKVIGGGTCSLYFPSPSTSSSSDNLCGSIMDTPEVNWLFITVGFVWNRKESKKLYGIILNLLLKFLR